MSLGDYLTGLGWFSLTLGPVAVATALVARRRLGELDGAPRSLAIFVVATAATIAVHLVPLALGVLTRATPAVAGALLCLAVWGLTRRAPREATPTGPASAAEARTDPVPPAQAPPGPASPAHAPPSSRPESALALVAVAAAAIAVVGYVAAVAVLPFTQVDMVAFHLPGVASWIQTGTVWEIDQFLPYQAQGNYPHSGDVVALAAMLPWHHDFALRYVALPFVAAMAVAVYAVARELGAPAAPAVLYGAVAATIPSVAVSTLDFGLPDAVMYSTFATGVLFALRHARRGARLDLVLAGVALGVAFGVKWYAVPAVAVVVAVWAVGLRLAGQPWRRLGGDGARLVGLIAAFGGFWLLRNLIESGNPFFPARVAPLGLTLFDAPYDRYRELAGFTLSRYVDDPTILRVHVLPAFNRTLALTWIVTAAGTLGAVALAARMRPRNGRVIATCVAAVLVAVAYLFTPYSALGGRDAPTGVAANTRYVVPALLLGAAVTAWLAGRGRRLAVAVQLAGALAVADGLRRGFDDVPLRHLLLAAGLLAAAGAIALAWQRVGRPVSRGRAAAPGRPARATSPRPVAAIATAALLGLTTLAAAGYAVQRRFDDNRYREVEAPLAWVRDDAPRRVGLAGLWSIDGIYPVFPAFGPRLENEVEFVGPVRDELLVEYPDRASFVAALRRGRYDLLVVGNATIPGTPRRPNEALARSAGYEVVSRSHRLVLLRPGAPTR